MSTYSQPNESSTEAAPRMAVIHTVAFLVQRFKDLLGQHCPGVDAYHVLDESLLQDLIRHGDSPGLVARVAAHARLAEDSGADLILFTCSSTSPAIDTARRLVAIPIVKIDDAMAQKAVAAGRRIGILCTTPSTQGPSSDLIRTQAQTAGREVEIIVDLQEPAYRALTGGDRATHDRLVSEAAVRLAGNCDVLVLAQASLAHLGPDLQRSLPIPVLTSPELCIADLAQRFAAAGPSDGGGSALKP